MKKYLIKDYTKVKNVQVEEPEIYTVNEIELFKIIDEKKKKICVHKISSINWKNVLIDKLVKIATILETKE
jgi:hypothetical protein